MGTTDDLSKCTHTHRPGVVYVGCPVQDWYAAQLGKTMGDTKRHPKSILQHEVS